MTKLGNRPTKPPSEVCGVYLLWKVMCIIWSYLINKWQLPGGKEREIDIA